MGKTSHAIMAGQNGTVGTIEKSETDFLACLFSGLALENGLPNDRSRKRVQNLYTFSFGRPV
jgi:hypothetical protein